MKLKFLLSMILLIYTHSSFGKTDPSSVDPAVLQEYRLITAMNGAEKFRAAVNATAKKPEDKITLEEAEQIRDLKRLADASGSCNSASTKLAPSPRTIRIATAMCILVGNGASALINGPGAASSSGGGAK